MPRGVYDRQPKRRPGRPKTTEEPLTSVRPSERPATGQGGGNGAGCEGCPGRALHGLNVAELQVVERAVRQGLGIQASVELLRGAQAAK